MNPYATPHVVTTVWIIPAEGQMCVKCLCGWTAAGPTWQVRIRRWAHRLANGT
jgi:hypothetical protein